MPTIPTIEVRLVRGPVIAHVEAPRVPAAGGECLFLGRTRAETHDVHGALSRLDYEAYEPMAERVLRTLANEAVERHGCLFVRLHHALGPVAVGEASVLVQVACPRRDAAFAACRELIDRLKAEAPIWKREVWAAGATWSPGVAIIAAGGAGDTRAVGQGQA